MLKIKYVEVSGWRGEHDEYNNKREMSLLRCREIGEVMVLYSREQSHLLFYFWKLMNILSNWL